MKIQTVSLSELSSWKNVCAVFLFCAATTIASGAQTFSTLFSFDGPNGANPEYMSLFQGADGNLYGTTFSGGANFSSGTIFKITPRGALSTLYNFCSQTGCIDGSNPRGGLVQGTDGNFYGTTQSGGTDAYGTIFKITPGGKLTTLHSFDVTDGAFPTGALLQGTDRNLYGITGAGGAKNYGTIFKITAGGTLTTVYSFCAQTNCLDGSQPFAGLVQAVNGNFYGTTEAGGANNYGTVFEATPEGTLTTLHSFDLTDGADPVAGLVQGTDGNFYGTVGLGLNDVGNVFKITPEGALTTLHSFDSTDGAYPMAGLVQGTNGYFYGTTYGGGVNGVGTIFAITSQGALTTLHSFDSTDGANPYVGLVQATNGDFYGATYTGGANLYYGTVFSLSVGLRPFVETQPRVGKAGTTVIILGTNLKGATEVTFNNTAATFTVVSHSEIRTTVPSGATSGFVSVTTPTQVLKSNVVFRVTK